MDERERRIALLIDADNAPASKIDVILAEVARHGAANVRRAYGKNHRQPSDSDRTRESGTERLQTFA